MIGLSWSSPREGLPTELWIFDFFFDSGSCKLFRWFFILSSLLLSYCWTFFNFLVHFKLQLSFHSVIRPQRSRFLYVEISEASTTISHLVFLAAVNSSSGRLDMSSSFCSLHNSSISFVQVGIYLLRKLHGIVFFAATLMLSSRSH